MGKKVTIDMVAKEAGVSRGTIDRVLNQRPHVKEDQRKRVMAAIWKLGYIPKNRQAKSLGLDFTQPQVRRLGVLIPKKNPYFTRELERGIFDARIQLADLSIEVVIERCSTTFPEEMIEKMERLASQDIKGLVLCPIDCDPVIETINRFSRAGIAIATIDMDIDCERLFFFGNNIVRCGRVAGALMTRYLSPEDRILVGVGNLEIEENRIQKDAFMDAACMHGWDRDRFEVIETYGDYTLSYRKVKNVLEKDCSVKGVYMTGHSLTGCMDAIRQSGHSGSVFTIAGYISERTVIYLKNGELDYCVTPNVYMQGYQPLISLKRYIWDEEHEPISVLHSTTEIISCENVIEY